MGYPTQQQKVDYLFKKIGFTKTKTGVAEDQTSGFSGDTKKAPPNEAIASPLIVPGSSVWSDSSFITATPPTSSTAYVGVYSTATSYRMTVDTTVANERTFIARQTWGNPSSAIEGDWIDTQFGADYLVKVYMGDPSTGVPGVAYTNLSAAGTSGKDDVWFFDYSSGVLNFNGADLDGQLAGISTDNVYLVGYRYVGRKGIQPPAGIGTFHDLVVSNNFRVGGISTFNGDVNVATNAKIKVGTGLTSYFDSTNIQHFNNSNVFHNIENSGQREAWASRVSGVLVPQFRINHNSAVEAYYANGSIKFSTSGIGITVYGQLDTTTLNVSGVSTFGSLIDANGKIVGIQTDNVIPFYYDNTGDFPSAATYHGAFAHAHNTGKAYFAHAGWKEIISKEATGVVGTGTETYHIGNLNVTGITTLGSIGISTGLITGPAVTYIDPATVGDNTGTLVVKGNLQVDGTQTTVNSSTMTVTDKNIEIAKGAANDAAADGAGITVESGDGDKTWNWVDATDSWTSSEHIRIPDDKVFGFASDTNTYIGRPAADTIAFTHGGDEKVRITSDGKIGIGTNTVTDSNVFVEMVGSASQIARLQFDNKPVVGSNNGEIGGILFRNNADSVAYIRCLRESAADDAYLQFATQATGGGVTERLRIMSGGSIGINTTTGTNTVNIGGVAGLGVRFTNFTSGTAAFITLESGDKLQSNVGGTGYYTWVTGGTEKVRINPAGRVGIGTTIPFGANAGLEVYKATNNASINIRSAGAGAYLYLDSNSNGYYGVQLSTGSGANPKWFVGGYGSNDLNIQSTGGMVSGNKLISINSSGNVGIGTNVMGAGGRSLTLAHTGNCTFTIRSGASSNGNIYFADGTSGTAQYMGMIEYNQATNRMSFYTNGDTSNSKLRILSDGNVGINSASPAAKLDVVGSGKFSDNLTVNGNLAVVGVSTFSAGTVKVTKSVQINENLNVTGIATFSSSIVTPPGYGGNFANINIGVTGNNEIDTDAGTGNLILDSAGGTINIDDGATIAGVSTHSEGIFVPDDKSIRVGGTFANPDFKIHSSSTYDQAVIDYSRSGTGRALRVRATNLQIENWNGLTPTVKVIGGVGAGHVELNYAGDKKFETTSSGVGIAGSVTVSNDLSVTGITTTGTFNTGDATFTGTISAGSTTGTDGYYLKTTGIGVTWAAFPSSRTGLTTSATAGQTSFNFSYNVGFLDVFLNGVKLPSSEFTASNGSTIVLGDAAFVNDTLEFISLNTLPVTSGGSSNLTGLADVTITGTPVIGETLQHNGSVFVNDYTPSATTTSTSQTAILSLAIATYRSVEYTVQITEGTKYHVTKILAIHDGTNVSFNEYGTLFTTSSLATFALDVNSGNMRLLATPASTNSTVFKVKFNAIKV